MFPSLNARETHVAETNFDARKQKNIFALSQKYFCFPNTKSCVRNMFPSLATMKTMVISFHCRLLIKSVSLLTIKMADCEEIEAGQVGEGRDRNRKDKEREMLITLYEERPCPWDAGHKDHMNRDSKKVAYSQIDSLMSDKYDINREDFKSKWKSVYDCTHA